MFSYLMLSGGLQFSCKSVVALDLKGYLTVTTPTERRCWNLSFINRTGVSRIFFRFPESITTAPQQTVDYLELK